MSVFKSLSATLKGYNGSLVVDIFKYEQTFVSLKHFGLIRWASLTKPLVALVVVRIVEKHNIDFDIPIGINNATLKNLLDHTSGMSFDSTKILMPPGKMRIYSNAGYRYLEEFLKKEFSIDLSLEVIKYLHEVLNLNSAIYDNDPASGVSSSFADLYRFVKRLRSGKCGIDIETFKIMRAGSHPGIPGRVPSVGSYEDNLWGLGFELKGKKQPHWMPGNIDGSSFGHFGASGAFFFIDPVKKLSFVGFDPINSDDFAKRWSELLTKLVDEVGKR